jgi:hypothetical protein
LQLSYRRIDTFWEESRRLGFLTKLYRERVDDWRLLKCARAYAKHVGEVRNAKLTRLLERVFALSGLGELSRAGKSKVGVWGSAGLRGELLRLYLGLKNASVPRQLPIDLHY